MGVWRDMVLSYGKIRLTGRGAQVPQNATRMERQKGRKRRERRMVPRIKG